MSRSIGALVLLLVTAASVQATVVVEVPLPTLAAEASIIVVGSASGGAGPEQPAIIAIVRTVKGPISLTSITAAWPAETFPLPAGAALYGLWFLRETPSGSFELMPRSTPALSAEDVLLQIPPGALRPEYQYPTSEPLLDRIVKEIQSGLASEPDVIDVSPLFTALDSVAHPAPTVYAGHDEEMTPSMRSSHDESCATAALARGFDAMVVENIRRRVVIQAGIPPGLLMALGSITDPGVIPGLTALASALSESDGLTRVVADAVRRIHTRSALPLLNQYLYSTDLELQELGVNGLALYANNYAPGNVGFGVPPPGPLTTAETRLHGPAIPEFMRDPARYVAFWRSWCMTQSCDPNNAPTVSLSASSVCTPVCRVTFTAAAQDPDGDSLTHSWSGCSSGVGPVVTCDQASSGTVSATVRVADPSGAFASADKTVTVYARGHSVSEWNACSGSGAYNCSSASATGCTRPGVQTRFVAEASWTVSPGEAALRPASTQACTQTAQGYVAGFSAGPWGACSASCGGGFQYRTVNASSWKATAPSAPSPPDSQACNTQSCELTCYDYPDAYPTWGECRAVGYTVCETRYRSNGLGGWLTCRVGFW